MCRRYMGHVDFEFVPQSQPVLCANLASGFDHDMSQFRNGALFKKKRIVRVSNRTEILSLNHGFLLFLVLDGNWSWLKSLNV